MSTRQYIGARYVPKFFNFGGSAEWRSGVTYESLTIVTRNGNSYTSKIPVPSNIGAPESNPDYWVPTGLYNEQVERIRNLAQNTADSLNNFMAEGAIGTDNLADGAVTNDKLADGAIESDNLADGAVTNDKLADGTIEENKLDASFLNKIKNYYVTPEQFGAVGDGVTDDTEAWNLAILSGEVIVAKNIYKTSETLSFTNDVYMTGKIVNDVSNPIISLDTVELHHFILCCEATSQSATERTGIKIKNCNSCAFNISVRNCYDGLELIGENSGCCYNFFNNVFIANSQHHVKITNDGTGWCNENYFNNVRFLNSSVSIYHSTAIGVYIRKGTNASHFINAINFNNASMESMECAIDIDQTFDSNFDHIRTEGCTYAVRDTNNTGRNTVKVSYGTLNSDTVGNTVINNGLSAIMQKYSKLVASTGVINDIANTAYYASAPNLYKVTDVGAILPMVDHANISNGGLNITAFSLIGKLINTEQNKNLVIRCKVSSSHRYFVIPFDANNNVITDANVHSLNTPWTYQTSGAKHFTIGSDVPADNNEIYVNVGESTHHVYIGVRMTSGILHEIAIYGESTNYEMYNSDRIQLPAIPTSTGMYIGQRVYGYETNASWQWSGSAWVAIT